MMIPNASTLPQRRHPDPEKPDSSDATNVIGGEIQTGAPPGEQGNPNPIYELVQAKGGPKLHPSNGGRSSTSSAGGKMTVTDLSMEAFAYQLSRHLSRPVFDGTG